MNRVLVIKLLALAVMAWLLSLGVKLIEHKAEERRAARDQAVASITQSQASDQVLQGVLLRARYAVAGTDGNWNISERFIAPDAWRVDGQLAVTRRWRGIYAARLYEARLTADAEFTLPPDPGKVLESLTLIVGFKDARGLKKIQLRLADQGELPAARALEPASAGQHFTHALAADLPVAQAARAELAPLRVAADIVLTGAGSLGVATAAADNAVRLSADWPHPSFQGRYLPDQHQITEKGFSSQWTVNQMALGGATDPAAAGSDPLRVALIDPVDAYTGVSRTLRYGALFVLLTFGGVFLYELIHGRPVHPMQYLLAGAAVSVFFLLLLALSEHLAFGLAYGLAAAACTALLTGYGRSILGGWAAASGLGAAAGVLYTGFYLPLVAEDFGLLSGSLLVFGALAMAMYLTRRVDWYRIGLPRPLAASAASAQEAVS